MIRVEKERWESAQAWEKRHWINTQRARARYGKNVIWQLLALLGLKSKYRGDDWNYWWQERFNGYDFLPSVVENAVELGCGPYTNMRLIVDCCKPKHLFLSDPLIRTYVDFRLTFVSEMYRKGFCTLDDHPLEESPFASDYFDLTVMINVLDHVQDAERCIGNAIRITKPKGILIVGQDLADGSDKAKIEASEGEIGHPLKLTHRWLEGFLTQGFAPIINQILPREQGRDPEYHYGTLIFAGKRIGSEHAAASGSQAANPGFRRDSADSKSRLSMVKGGDQRMDWIPSHL